ncbi:MAG: GH92 family glycosyl hydrolase [Saprospiraceae bacterium]|jgi:predicted alpha-1,2-mannosidase|nr:GH92 family glycosyl hydrolase [Saprospiraceae bacterium]
MKFSQIISILFFFFAFFACKNEAPTPIDKPKKSLSSYVDPFIGTANHGHVYPGATVPFGMVQLSPDNGTAGWDWCSGYNWADSMIVGFSHTHLSGTGIGDLYDISIMPIVNEVDFSKEMAPRENNYAATFSHDNESASTGYYTVKLDNGIDVELTTSERVGFHNYTFPEEKQAGVLIDLGFNLNWDKPTKTVLTVDSKNLITGHRFSTGWAKDQRVYFAAQFSEDFNGSFQIAEGDSNLYPEIGKTVDGTKARVQVFFDTIKNVKIKVGLSTANAEGALAALNEVPNWDFEEVRSKAESKWEKELSKIEISSNDEDLKKTFYTSLYRTCLAPVLMSDANGNYKGVDNEIHASEGYTKYGVFSLWDTFRAANPLYTLTQPDKINDFINSMLAHYDEYGLLPVWELLGNETNTMTGYHSIPVIVDAYLKGYQNFDAEKAFEAMRKSASQDIRGTNFYREYGYIPYDKAGQSVTRTLEYAFDDWCIAQMAKALGKEEDYQNFMKRSEGYRHFFDESTGFMRAKYSNGKWKTPFDPQFSDHNFDVAEYTEGNAWQHSWFVPHAVEDLIKLHGGNEPFVNKMDSLFTVSSEIRGENASNDISGLIGQYAHGNEPSHHIAYLYNYADTPSKTQEKVREIMATQYNTTPTGLCGNEDCGQMSAWYVFSAMGIYPVNPASGVYDFGSPLFEEVKLKVGNGKTFVIKANDVSKNNKYIKSVKLNGEVYDKLSVTHEDLMKGGILEFEMSNK